MVFLSVPSIPGDLIYAIDSLAGVNSSYHMVQDQTLGIYNDGYDGPVSQADSAECIVERAVARSSAGEVAYSTTSFQYCRATYSYSSTSYAILPIGNFLVNGYFAAPTLNQYECDTVFDFNDPAGSSLYNSSFDVIFNGGYPNCKYW